MALTRKFLSALGIEADKIDEIITAHSETVDGLKNELATAKEAADKLPTVQKELDELKAAAEKDGKSTYKVKYEAIKEEFDAYKAEQTAKQTKEAKETAYKELLEKAGVSAKRIPAILKVTDLDAVELDDKGAIKDAEKHTATIKSEWADFIGTTQTVGAATATPPTNTGGALKTREEIYKRDENGKFVLDSSQRQAALAQLIAAQQQKG